MKINLAKKSRIYVDTSGPHINLPEDYLSRISDGLTTVSGITVSGGNTLALICDLGARYNLDQLIYYRNQNNTEQIVFQAKQNELDVWTTISKQTSATTVSSTLTNTVDKYRFLRVAHSISSGTSNAFEIEIYTNDQPLDYAADPGRQISLDSGTTTLSPLEIPIINNDIDTQIFYNLLDPDEKNSKDIKLSQTSVGPYYGLYENAISLPTTYTFSSGYFVNTNVVGQGVQSTATVGYYYTPVIDIQGLEGRRLFWQSTISGGEIDSSLTNDNLPTISIRTSTVAPTDISWSSGLLSLDSLWHPVSGTLPFVQAVNNQILDYKYNRYFQAKVEFFKPAAISPQLDRIGVEGGLSITISGGSTGVLYAKSTLTDDEDNRKAGILSWFFQNRSDS